ncbi:MAG TPA: hypothetical protein VIV65_06260 [Gemmatimonadaceae bacterium]|jgi:hypothetical protein
MASTRSFAALIDQDGVILIEYQEEKAGFRVLATRSESRRLTTPEAAVDLVVRLLGELGAKTASVSIVLQHFGSFFHTLLLPPAEDDVVRSIILREVQRSFNVSDPAFSYLVGSAVERRESPRPTSPAVPRQVLVAGAPRSVVAALHSGLTKARVKIDGLTVIPEVFRQVYDSLDGSTEATAVLVCLSNGPHLAFFVNGHLELAIEPPPAVEGGGPIDTTVILDQLERGAIFLRQQSRGMVATRVLLSAPAAEYESLASTIEARTGMRVADLGQGIGSPQTLVAMGAVLAARAGERLDLIPRAPSLEQRIRMAVAGPSAITTAACAITVAAFFWAGIQFMGLVRDRSELIRLQREVSQAIPAVAALRQSAEGRQRIADIRSILSNSRDDRRRMVQLLASFAAAAPPGAQIDSFTVDRTQGGLKTAVFGRAAGPSSAKAVAAATTMYHHFQRQPRLRDLDFQVIAYLPAAAATDSARAANASQLIFTVTFLSPDQGGP